MPASAASNVSDDLAGHLAGARHTDAKHKKNMEGKTRRTKQDTTEQGSQPRMHRMLRKCKTAEDNARQFKRATAASRTQPAEASRRHREKKLGNAIERHDQTSLLHTS